MPKVKNGQDAILTRDKYNALKRMDRTDAEDFAQEIYKKGYIKGGIDTELRLRAELDSVKGPLREREPFAKELEQFFRTIKIPGVGAATLFKIHDAAKHWNDAP